VKSGPPPPQVHRHMVSLPVHESPQRESRASGHVRSAPASRSGIAPSGSAVPPESVPAPVPESVPVAPSRAPPASVPAGEPSSPQPTPAATAATTTATNTSTLASAGLEPLMPRWCRAPAHATTVPQGHMCAGIWSQRTPGWSRSSVRGMLWRMRSVLGFVVCLVVVSLVGATAVAEDAEVTESAAQIRPTVAWSIAGGEHGLGAGLEYRYFPSRAAWRYGAYAEGMFELDGAVVAAGGLSGGWGGCGLSLGVGHRSAGDFDAQTFLELGKSFTFGPAGIALRASIPLATHEAQQGPDLPARGFTVGVVLSLGWSFTVQGERPSGCSATGCSNWRDR